MNIKIYIGIILITLVGIFIIQNAIAVDIKFLFWKLSMSRSLMIFFILGIGIAIGVIAASIHHNRSHNRGDSL